MNALPNCGKLEVRNSPIEGFGVFATDDIPAGTVLEEVPFVLFPRYVNVAKGVFDLLRSNGWVNSKEVYMENLRHNLRFKDPEKYYFKWHPPVQMDGDSMFTVLPLGYGPIYNTSNTSNNADWKMMENTFVFRAEKDIKKDDEIRTFYGYYLGEDGAIFPCESVFHFGIDMVKIGDATVHKLRALRFGNLESFNSQSRNPVAHKIHKMLFEAEHGISFKKIYLIAANQTSPNDFLGMFDVPEFIGLTALYQKLVEVKNHPAPIVKFDFEYTSNITHQIVKESIVWKK